MRYATELLICTNANAAYAVALLGYRAVSTKIENAAASTLRVVRANMTAVAVRNHACPTLKHAYAFEFPAALGATFLFSRIRFGT